MNGAIPLLPTCAFLSWAGTLHCAADICTQKTKQLTGCAEIIDVYFKIHMRKAVWENGVFFNTKASGAYNYHYALNCSPFSSHKS
jgi:hypothetical protein